MREVSLPFEEFRSSSVHIPEMRVLPIMFDVSIRNVILVVLRETLYDSLVFEIGLRWSLDAFCLVLGSAKC